MDILSTLVLVLVPGPCLVLFSYVLDFVWLWVFFYIGFSFVYVLDLVFLLVRSVFVLLISVLFLIGFSFDLASFSFWCCLNPYWCWLCFVSYLFRLELVIFNESLWWVGSGFVFLWIWWLLVPFNYLNTVDRVLIWLEILRFKFFDKLKQLVLISEACCN